MKMNRESTKREADKLSERELAMARGGTRQEPMEFTVGPVVVGGGSGSFCGGCHEDRASTTIELAPAPFLGPLFPQFIIGGVGGGNI